MVSENDILTLEKKFHRVDFQNVVQINFREDLALNEIFETRKSVIEFPFFVKIFFTVGLRFCFEFEFEKFGIVCSGSKNRVALL